MTEIKTGNCYMCLKDIGGYDSFTKGKVYSSLYDNALINDNHIEVKVMPSDYFRIATNKEIKAQISLMLSGGWTWNYLKWRKLYDTTTTNRQSHLYRQTGFFGRNTCVYQWG